MQAKPESEWKPKDHEEVICLRRGWVENNVGRFNGFYGGPGFSELARRSSPDNWQYIKRGYCETDSSWKQLIPYIMVVDVATTPEPRVLTYYRTTQAGEQRLHGKRSIGFGGHLGRKDGNTLPIAIQAGAERELNEEIEIDGPYRVRQLGLLNDDSTEVGQVHMGVVLVAELCERDIKVTKLDEELGDLAFVPVSELFGYYNPVIHDEFEDWSKILLTCYGVVRDNQVMDGPTVWRHRSFVT